MRTIYLLLLSLLVQSGSLACPACKKQQPKLLRGITHGVGPDSQWDYVIVVITLVIVLLTLFYSIKWLIKPNETRHLHIKTSIINEW
jgi:phage shock protein PspC (stress-responsive transcriptional regulator)